MAGKTNIRPLKAIKTVLYILTITGIFLFLYYKKSELQHLLHIHYTNIILLIGVGIIPVSLNALLFRNNISIFNLHLSFKEWYGLTVSNTMYNYLLPARGGMALRALYLKQNHVFPYVQYVSFTAGTYILNLAIAAFTAFILSVGLFLFNALESIILLYISFALLIFIIGVIGFLYKFNPHKLPERYKVLKWIKQAAQGIKQFKYHPDKVFNLAAIQLGFMLAISLRLFVAFYLLEIPVNYPKLVLINALVAFSMVFSVTPGNIGIKEGIIGLSSSLLGISTEEALLGAVLDRVVAMIVVFGLGSVFSRILLNKI